MSGAAGVDLFAFDPAEGDVAQGNAPLPFQLQRKGGIVQAGFG
ncbi:MAG: hypothetical protein ACE5HN_04345 [Nitrospiria bacterium]